MRTNYLTKEEMEVVREVETMVAQLNKWFKKLDRESRDNLFNMMDREKHIQSMKVKEVLTLKEVSDRVTKYPRNSYYEVFDKQNVMLVISEAEGRYNILVKNKLVIQLDTITNNIEVMLSDVSTVYGVSIIYKPPYNISAREIVEVIKTSLKYGGK